MKSCSFSRVLTRFLEWEGAAPFCSAIPGKQYGCNEKDRKSLTYSSYGAGGEERCSRGNSEPRPVTLIGSNPIVRIQEFLLHSTATILRMQLVSDLAYFRRSARSSLKPTGLAVQADVLTGSKLSPPIKRAVSFQLKGEANTFAATKPRLQMCVTLIILAHYSCLSTNFCSDRS